MNKIEELLTQLCPDGVEMTTLGKIAKLSRGKVISKTYLRDNPGEFPVYSSQTANNGELGRINTFDYNGSYLTWTTDGAYAGTIFRREGKFNITNVCGLVDITDNRINYNFLYFWLSVNAKKYVYSGMGNPKLMSNVMETIKVPLPPLIVQEKIAEILNLYVVYTAELQAELQARKEQYEYYRNHLLTHFNPEQTVTEYSLEELFDYRGGYTPSKSNSDFWENPSIPWFRMEDIRENGRILNCSLQSVNTKAVKRNGLIKANSFIVATSATIGEHALITTDFLANQRFTCLTLKDKHKKDIYIKYLFYYFYLLDEWCKSHINQGGFASVDMDSFYKYVFKIPPLAEQIRITSILDQFEELVNDLSQGLPAEIAAVQEQYEYYRNKLLTF